MQMKIRNIRSDYKPNTGKHKVHTWNKDKKYDNCLCKPVRFEDSYQSEHTWNCKH